MLIVPKFLSGGYAAVRDTAIPALCLMCDAILDAPGGCCADCWKKLNFIAPPICPVTGMPFPHDPGEGIVSADAIANPPPYSRCRSAVTYDDEVRRLITGLKYSDRLDLAPWLANWMVTAGGELFEDSPVIIPVPLYASRLIGRRYNQSAELARHISHRTGLDYLPNVLMRHRNTRQQVGLGSKERERNVQGAFRIKQENAGEITGKNILLIDDVYTSGATVKSATRALKRAGSGPVDVLTFARVKNVE